MKLFRLFLTIYYILIFGCSSSKTRVNNLKGIVLSWSFPIVAAERPIVHNVKDSLFIFYQGDMTLIRIPFEENTYNKNALKNDTLVFSDDKMDIAETAVKFDNFVFKNGERKGLRFGETGLERLDKFDVDSLLKTKAFETAKLYDTTDEQLVDVLNQNKLKVERYYRKFKPDVSFSDSTYYYFAKGYDEIPYSLSKKADKEKKMKLVKVTFIYTGTLNREKGLSIPRKEISIGITKAVIDDPTYINSYFERFQAEKSSKFKPSN